jgi:ribosomal protein L7/L12
MYTPFDHSRVKARLNIQEIAMPTMAAAAPAAAAPAADEPEAVSLNVALKMPGTDLPP